MKSKILTILIPTYNRSSCLQKSLENFCLKNFDNDIEILVAINASSDGSKEIVKSYEQKIFNLKSIYFEEFLFSAEENINRSIKHCVGKYIFILGDDDIVLYDTFDFMISILRKDKNNLPALIFNNISSHNHLLNFSEKVQKKSPAILNFTSDKEDKIWHSTYLDLLKYLGTTSTMSFISRYVIRKDLLKDFSSHINRSRIYSHVFAFLEFLNEQKLLVVDLPLTHRGNSDVTERLGKMSKTTSRSFFFPWHYGLLMHIENAIKERFIKSSWFFEVIEHREDGTNYALWQSTLGMFLMQIRHYITSDKNPLEEPKQECLEILKNFDNNTLPFDHKTSFNHILYQTQLILLNLKKPILPQEEKTNLIQETVVLYKILEKASQG